MIDHANDFVRHKSARNMVTNLKHNEIFLIDEIKVLFLPCATRSPI